ncbi:TRAP transporter large permease [Anaeromicrobium sediminis]|uniref:C4-dicarboxylate ABC transporter permease n=1 Tax=Anaeromicrobium sediminis TaxID=1478221 RepID=A0A267MIJ1_9FIRM|nr:TRAP transporter large permease [Anaeromicrobium sediminis]PAB59232.1 C4-dicarboxylate ABC transporter permease [Anaeromicrobium sediminis]
MVLTLMAIMITLLVLGFPMMVPMIVAPLVIVLMYFPNIDPQLLTQQLIAGVQPFVLLAVPMFIFAADIMCAGQTANRLLDLVETFVGHVHGGMAITTAASCTLFGAISGSTQATVVAIGKPMRQKLLDIGYKEKDVLALIINSSDIALLIPPSIGMIMYAVVTGASVGELFIAGVGPGLLILAFFAIYSYVLAKKQNVPRRKRATWEERLRATKKALLPLGFPIIIIGGIYSGFFSPTEAAAASVLYAFILEVFIFKTIKVSDIPSIALSTGLVTAAVFILVAGGQAFSWTISYAKIPQMITSTLLGTSPTALKILFTVTLFYFIGCMFVDPIVVIIILTPIFYPLALKAGVDPIHLGIIITLQAAIGSATPPFGCDIFTACAVFDKPYLDVIKGTPPYIVMLIAISIIMIFFPEVALFFRDVAVG